MKCLSKCKDRNKIVVEVNEHITQEESKSVRMIWSCVAKTVELNQKTEAIWFKWKYKKDSENAKKIEQNKMNIRNSNN